MKCTLVAVTVASEPLLPVVTEEEY